MDQIFCIQHNNLTDNTQGLIEFLDFELMFHPYQQGYLI